MTMYAKVIADSIANDIRLTTMELYYPLIIHAQLMTHRMFSRNAQSNRAMPVNKVLEQVRNNPAMPSRWGKNQAGMEDAGEHDESVDTIGMGMEEDFLSKKRAWKEAAQVASGYSEAFSEAGYHKQVANRLTMPFQYIKVIVTATDFSNFFSLRLNDADPTMMELAGMMHEAILSSIPKELKSGEWHLPYISNEDLAEGWNYSQLRRMSAARCARVSYNNHDNSAPNVGKDLELAHKLLKDGHMSPFEHQATPMDMEKDEQLWHSKWEKGVTHTDRNYDMWSGNFRGWIQYRQIVG